MDMEVAFSFSKPCSSGPWGGCTFGERLRILLVCHVRDRNRSGSLPGKYLIVKAADETRLSHIIVFVDTPSKADFGRLSFGLSTDNLVIVAYALILLCFGMSQNMYAQRWLASMFGRP
mmetsp:Transcript_36505/g.103106  ORF Transcript_36505/g.103106 Transcript_36505/m.103106 type:complete len:118 (+) Transcript_36505:728-1081(+)